MKKSSKNLIAVFLTLVISFGYAGQVWAANFTTTELISKHTDGTLGDESVWPGSGFGMSEDGRYIVFESVATNIVNNDTNGVVDVFVRDTQLNTTTRVSVNTAGEEGVSCNNGPSGSQLAPSGGSMSSDGRYIVFHSDCDNLVANDNNNKSDIFLRDTQLNTTTRVSVSTAGVEQDGYSYNSSMSSDGRYITFYSTGTNLVAGDTNAEADIFLRDTQLNITTRVSISTGGSESDNQSTTSIISANGRYVVFRSNATNLVAGDTNAVEDVFVRDTQLNTTTRVSISTGGSEGDIRSFPYGISADGGYVLFYSEATNLVTGDTNAVGDVFIRDTQLNTTTRVSVSTAGVEGNGESYAYGISADGRYALLSSEATNLVTGDTNAVGDVFIRDTQLNTTTRVSVSTAGVEGNGYSGTGGISPDGQTIVFLSSATNIVVGDTNGFDDLFLARVLSAPTTTTQSASSITTTTATLNGNITDTGGEANTERGFDIGTDNTYTMTDVADPTGSYSTGAYTGSATGLTCGTTYHYRAYSTNTAGTGTGSDESFTTSACPVSVTVINGAVPVWILQQMSDSLRGQQNSTNNQQPQILEQSKFQFTKNLKYRDRNTDVLELQKFLNNNGYPISKSGIGSKGNETTYFGLATRSALIKYQKANNIKPAVGYFGAVTRRVVNK